MESWRKVLKNVRPRAFQIQLEDVRIYATDTFGYVTCVEVIDADDSKGRIAATNVFEVQGGRWVITHHHGAPTRLAF
jgi:translation initiation factor 2A